MENRIEMGMQSETETWSEIETETDKEEPVSGMKLDTVQEATASQEEGKRNPFSCFFCLVDAVVVAAVVV